MEFALAIPVVLLVVVGAVGLVGAARTQLELAGAAREGARVAATQPDPARAVAAVHAALGPDGSAARVSVRRPRDLGGMAEVTVRMRHEVLPGWSIELAARAVMGVER